MKEFADDNIHFDEIAEKFSEREENTVEKEKLLIMNNFSFSPSVFKRSVLQTGKGLILSSTPKIDHSKTSTTQRNSILVCIERVAETMRLVCDGVEKIVGKENVGY